MDVGSCSHSSISKAVPAISEKSPLDLLGRPTGTPRLLPSAWSSPNHWGHLGDEPTGGGTGWANALNAEGDYTQAGIASNTTWMNM